MPKARRLFPATRVSMLKVLPRVKRQAPLLRLQTVLPSLSSRHDEIRPVEPSQVADSRLAIRGFQKRFLIPQRPVTAA